MKHTMTLAAILAAISTPALSQDAPSPPGFVPEHWVTVNDAEGNPVLVHKFSGALCPRTLTDLTITGLVSYNEEGNNVSCGYVSSDGSKKITAYFYKFEGLTGPQAFSGAVQAINQMAETTALTIAHEQTESQRCQRVMAQGMSNTLPTPEGQNSYPFGFTLFDVDGPETGKGSEVDDVTALTVFEYDGWIVKVRYTGSADAGGNGYYQACAASAYAMVQSAEAMKQNAGMRSE